MKKVRYLVIGLISCLFFFGGASNSSTKEVKANTSSSVVSSVVVEEENKTVTFEDLDNDGIPDVINDYYNENIRDQYMFGIGLGAILGVMASIISTIYIAKKNNGATKEIKATSEKTNIELLKIVTELKNELNNLKDENSKLIVLNNKYVNDYKLLASEIINSNEKSTKVLTNYAKINDKLDITLSCIEEIVQVPTMVKEGITSKVVSKINEVK